MSNTTSSKKKMHCCFYNSLKIVIDERLVSRHGYNPDDVAAFVYTCCVHQFSEEGYPLGCLTINDIKDNNVYNKLLEMYANNNYSNKTFDDCRSFIYSDINNNQLNVNDDVNEYICDWNNGPINDIQVCTPSCNLKCIMCRGEIYTNNKMDELYFSILEQLKDKGISQLSFTQSGEPFLHKKQMMDYLRSLKLNTDFSRLFFISNLTLLNEDDIIELVNIRNKGFSIGFVASIDGITKETYTKIRQNDLFDKVVHNATLLASYNLLNQINYVVQPLNIHELDLVEDFWKNINPKINVNLIPEGSCKHKMRILIDDYKKRKGSV